MPDSRISVIYLRYTRHPDSSPQVSEVMGVPVIFSLGTWGPSYSLGSFSTLEAWRIVLEYVKVKHPSSLVGSTHRLYRSGSHTLRGSKVLRTKKPEEDPCLWIQYDSFQDFSTSCPLMPIQKLCTSLSLITKNCVKKSTPSQSQP